MIHSWGGRKDKREGAKKAFNKKREKKKRLFRPEHRILLTRQQKK